MQHADRGDDDRTVAGLYPVTHRPSSGAMVGTTEPEEGSGSTYQASKPSTDRSIAGGACCLGTGSDAADALPARQFTDRERVADVHCPNRYESAAGTYPAGRAISLHQPLGWLSGAHLQESPQWRG